MKYLIDTNIVIDHFRDKPQVVLFFQKAKQSGFAISVITVGEIVEGLVEQQKEEQRHQDLDTFLTAGSVIDVDRKIIEIFAMVRSNLRGTGKLIENFDILIAATAIKHNLILVTNDKDFERIGGLKLKFIR